MTVPVRLTGSRRDAGAEVQVRTGRGQRPGQACRDLITAESDPVALTSGSDLHVNQTNHFFNLGYGWLCKHCSAEDAERKHNIPRPQFLQRSEPDKTRTASVDLALASWTDSTRNALTCPRCGIRRDDLSCRTSCVSGWPNRILQVDQSYRVDKSSAYAEF